MIKIGFLLSYDYELVKISLPLVYEHADLIVYAIDIDRLSWSGNKFNFDESILNWIREYDKDEKIEIYQDTFYLAQNSAMENDTYQRNKLAEYMGADGWHIQLDVDEYFLDFRSFTQFLNSESRYLVNPKKSPISFAVQWYNLFKSNENGFFGIVEGYNGCRIATNYPRYQKSRNTNHETIFTSFIIVHQSYDRSEDEIKFKFQNWSHKDDFNGMNYYDFWKSIDQTNYAIVKDFAPIGAKNLWRRLEFIDAKNIIELISKIRLKDHKSYFFIRLKKNMIQRIIRVGLLKKLYNKIVYKL